MTNIIIHSSFAIFLAFCIYKMCWIFMSQNKAADYMDYVSDLVRTQDNRRELRQHLDWRGGLLRDLHCAFYRRQDPLSVFHKDIQDLIISDMEG